MIETSADYYDPPAAMSNLGFVKITINSVVLTTLVKLLLKMSRKMGKKLKKLGKTLSEGSPMLAMGFYPPRVFQWPICWKNVGGIIIQHDLSCHFNGILIDCQWLRIRSSFGCVYYKIWVPNKQPPEGHLHHLFFMFTFRSVVVSVMCVIHQTVNTISYVLEDW